MRRVAVILVVVLAWAAFGFGVNRFLASRKSTLTAAQTVVTPSQETPAVRLSGTIFLSQAGHLYRLRGAQFTDLRLPASGGAWMQPAAAAPGQLLAVARADLSSDIYLIDSTTGSVVKQLTHNATTTERVELNAWSFFPHLAADGSTVVFDYDGPKTGVSFEVDMAVWGGPMSGALITRQWTTPNAYTGGDLSPIPLPDGSILYAQYSLQGDTNQVVSRLATVARPGSTPHFLTDAASDCNEPSVSPDGTELAMICTSDTQTAKLEVLPLTAAAPATPRVVVDGCLCASPAWSPDGTGLAYLAPADASGRFQLWWLQGAGAGAFKAPQQVTSHLDLDATSPPAWTS